MSTSAARQGALRIDMVAELLSASTEVALMLMIASRGKINKLRVVPLDEIFRSNGRGYSKLAWRQRRFCEVMSPSAFPAQSPRISIRVELDKEYSLRVNQRWSQDMNWHWLVGGGILVVLFATLIWLIIKSQRRDRSYGGEYWNSRVG